DMGADEFHQGRIFLHGAGENHPGGDGVAADALQAVLHGDVLGQGNDRRLGGAVGGAHHIAHPAGIRRGVDDGAAPRRNHVGDGVLAAEQEGGDVDVEGGVPDLQGNVHHGGVLGLDRQGGDGHVVVEHVEGAEGLHGAVDQRLDGVGVGGVVAHRDGVGADAFGEFAGGVDIEIADHHLGALGGIADGAGGADTGGASGNDGDLVGKTGHGEVLLCG